MTVPAIYQGLWRRKGIWRQHGDCDQGTQVWWLQSHLFHIDLRIPLDRPLACDRAAVAALPPGKLARFNAQSGCAGSTLVTGERCEWQPEIGFHALEDAMDAGMMRFCSPDDLHETGIDNSFQEQWVRMASGPMIGLRFEDPLSDDIAYLVVGQRWMGWACGNPRRTFDTGAPLAGGWNEVTILHKGSNWSVAGSTLPWLEGQDYPAASILERDQLARWTVGNHFTVPYAPHHLWRLTQIA